MIEGGEDGGQKGHTDSHLLTTHPHEGGDLLLAPNKDTHRQRQQKWGEKFTDTGKGEYACSNTSFIFAFFPFCCVGKAEE